MVDTTTKENTESIVTAWREVVLVGLSIIAGLTLVAVVFGTEATNFKEVGLGEGTHAVFQTYQQDVIHCSEINSLNSCIKDLPQAGSRLRGTWLGWSQIHGVNDYKEGQKLSPWLMVDKLRPRRIDLITASIANANPRELYLLYLYLQSKVPQDFLVWGAWLEGIRLEGIREEIAVAMNDADVVSALKTSDVGEEILDRWGPVGAQGSDGAIPAHQSAGRASAIKVDETTQARVENQLVKWMDERFDLFSARREAEGKLRVFGNDLRHLAVKARNFLLRIDVRDWQLTIPPARYETNMAAVRTVLETAKKNGTKVLIFVPPRPIDYPFRFDQGLYKKFKRETAQMAIASGAAFINLEDAVPGGPEIWGKTVSGDGDLVMDGTHFTAKGHGILAGALLKALADKGFIREPAQ